MDQAIPSSSTQVRPLWRTPACHVVSYTPAAFPLPVPSRSDGPRICTRIAGRTRGRSRAALPCARVAPPLAGLRAPRDARDGPQPRCGAPAAGADALRLACIAKGCLRDALHALSQVESDRPSEAAALLRRAEAAAEEAVRGFTSTLGSGHLQASVVLCKDASALLNRPHVPPADAGRHAHCCGRLPPTRPARRSGGRAAATPRAGPRRSDTGTCRGCRTSASRRRRWRERFCSPPSGFATSAR